MYMDKKWWGLDNELCTKVYLETGNYIPLEKMIFGSFYEITQISRELQCPFNSKFCYELYLSRKGFEYIGISNKKGSKRPTVKEFALKNRKGVFYLNIANHCVAVVDGIYYDTWDCGHKSLYGYWVRK